MDDFLEKIQLKNHFTVELQMEKGKFVNQFKKRIDEGSISPFSNLFGRFRSTNAYIGHVDLNGFEIKNSRDIFQKRRATVVATGTFTQMGRKLLVKAEVNSMHNFAKLSIIFTFIMFLVAYVLLSLGDDFTLFSVFGLFGLAYLLFFVVMTYYSLRRAMTKMKKHLEKDIMEIGGLLTTTEIPKISS